MSLEVQVVDRTSELAHRTKRPGQILDGTAVLAHDGADTMAIQHVFEEHPELQAVSDKAAATTATMPTGPALVRDMALSFYQAAPRIDPPVPLKAGFDLNAQVMQETMETKEWAAARALGTAGDGVYTAMAATQVASAVMESIPAQLRQDVAVQVELQSEMDKLFSEERTYEDLKSQLPPDADPADVEQIEDRLEQVRKLINVGQESMKEGQEVIDKQMPGCLDGARRAARTALKRATQQIEDLDNAVDAFSAGRGRGAGAHQQVSTSDRIKLGKALASQQKLKQFAELAGKFSRIALAQQRNRVDHPPSRVVSVTLGNDVSRILPHTMGLLGDPLLSLDFYRRFADRSLPQYKVVGEEPQGKGPIVIWGDTSSSMLAGNPTREVWSKAIMLATVAVAREQKRPVWVGLFGGDASELLTVEFSPDNMDPIRLVSVISTFFNSGTVYEPWMGKSIHIIRTQPKFKKADVILLTDGIADVSQAMHAEWDKLRKDTGTRCFSVLIGDSYGMPLLRSISDQVWELKDLVDGAGQTTVLNGLFSTV